MALYLSAHPGREQLRAQLVAIEKDLVVLQRSTAQPVPVRFVLRKAGE